MSSMRQQPGGPAAGGFDAAPVYRWVTVVTTVLVLIQAVLAGRGWFVDFDLIDIHGMVGNLVFVVTIGQTALVYLGRKRGGFSNLELGLNVAIVVLVIAQLGLGYSGRDTAGAAALHIPNGVLIFGIATALMTMQLKAKA
jgi:hypothetical protein